MNIEPNRTVATSARTRRTVLRRHMLAVPVLIAVLAGSAVGVTATDDTDPDDQARTASSPRRWSRASNASSATTPVTISTRDIRRTAMTWTKSPSRLMAPCCCWSSYHDTDNDAHPPGGLLWTLGEPGETTTPESGVFRYVPESDLGVICFDDVRERGSSLPGGRPHQRNRHLTGRHRLGRGRVRRYQRRSVSHHSRLFHKRRPSYHLTNHSKTCNQRRPGRSELPLSSGSERWQRLGPAAYTSTVEVRRRFPLASADGVKRFRRAGGGRTHGTFDRQHRITRDVSV